MRPRLLDLFAGAGGAAEGYHRAGFDVTGVDLAPQPRYPFAFVQADALEYLAEHGHEYEAIHASPPCQRYSTMTTRHGADRPDRHPDLVDPTRDLLELTGRPWIIENVPRAPLRSPLTLCGSMFGLRLVGRPDVYLRRHRLFESPLFLWPAASCDHRGSALAVYGHPGGSSKRDPGAAFGSVDEWREIMGIPWMSGDGFAEAIPPAYTEHVGRALLLAVTGSAA